MSRESALVVAHRQNQFWPSIHAASDVYLRRRGCGAEPYELIWRLIHIWECTVITLAAAAAARVRSISELADADRSIREKCYGMSRNDIIGKLERQGSGAFDGSVDRWVEILFVVSSLPLGRSPYLDALIHLLNGSEPTAGAGDPPTPSTIDLTSLLSAWRGACDVPSSLPSGPVDPKTAMRIVNSFRNRFAHVPFPYDRLDEILRHLESSTLQLFECQPLGNGAALLGGIKHQTHLVTGASHRPDEFENSSGEPCYVFAHTKKDPGEEWCARPFVHIDRMMRPYVLTRLRDDEEGTWEYTRYLAESNAIVLLTASSFFGSYPRPSETEYPAPPQPAAISSPIQQVIPPRSVTTVVANQEEAAEAIRQRQFDRVIPFLEQLVKERPNYHSGWLRLGLAKREKAVDLMDEGRIPEAVVLLDQAIEHFDKASNHAEPWGRADALYNRSKVHYRHWLISNEPDKAGRCRTLRTGSIQTLIRRPICKLG